MSALKILVFETCLCDLVQCFPLNRDPEICASLGQEAQILALGQVPRATAGSGSSELLLPNQVSPKDWANFLFSCSAMVLPPHSACFGRGRLETDVSSTYRWEWASCPWQQIRLDSKSVEPLGSPSDKIISGTRAAARSSHLGLRWWYLFQPRRCWWYPASCLPSTLTQTHTQNTIIVYFYYHSQIIPTIFWL